MECIRFGFIFYAVFFFCCQIHSANFIIYFVVENLILMSFTFKATSISSYFTNQRYFSLLFFFYSIQNLDIESDTFAICSRCGDVFQTQKHLPITFQSVLFSFWRWQSRREKNLFWNMYYIHNRDAYLKSQLRHIEKKKSISIFNLSCFFFFFYLIRKNFFHPDRNLNEIRNIPNFYETIEFVPLFFGVVTITVCFLFHNFLSPPFVRHNNSGTDPKIKLFKFHMKWWNKKKT